MTPSDNQNDREYLQELVLLMMKADSRRGALDTEAVALEGFCEYVGKICFLHDIGERHKLYRVCNIAYLTSTKTRYANWEATLEPIHIATSGEFYVADDDVIVGPKGIRITKSKVLLGYIVAQYIDEDEEEPSRTECVDLYVENAMEKLKAYVFKLQQSKSYALAT